MEDIELKYSVGALMYSPALNDKISKLIINKALGKRYSIALCLEDTVASDSVQTAELQVKKTIRDLAAASKSKAFYMPMLFVRVREPEQVGRIFEQIKEYQEVFTGFIFPKYTISNADKYNMELQRVNEHSHKKVYMMPILESGDIIDFRHRNEVLSEIKEKIDSMKTYVLNVRVGGNDFTNEFAVRRHCDETIYDILPIAQVLGDILTVFSRDYVVSGPVWEYFSNKNDEWKLGLINELKYDKLNGFIGKTVIHPKQIPVVNEMLKITRNDYEDAKLILGWDNIGLQVGKSFGGERMNEVKTHYNWAKKTVLLAEIYGVK